jgi:hypothetical protein
VERQALSNNSEKKEELMGTEDHGFLNTVLRRTDASISFVFFFIVLERTDKTTSTGSECFLFFYTIGNWLNSPCSSMV